MSVDRHDRISALFLATYELPPPRRRAVLEEQCGDDGSLRKEVEALLEKHDESASFLDEPGVLGPGFSVQHAATRLAPEPVAVGTRISHYHLKRLIATGGMGTVYEAVQEKPRRTVALKLMKRGLASRSALRRFEYESQILARLRHPGIAQVYEAGTHELEGSSVPYFAMEYIPSARSITEHAEEKRLGTRERLELFIKVCHAVHHGHQKGIIHRDLKPANILVDSSGEPKIIDFGVARSTDSDLAVTTLQTGVGQLLGTLQYMSPEQCAADPNDLDVRSDIYALGVVLYELVCGQLPYDVSRAPVHEAVQVVREATPVRPSSISRVLRGDIETITLKALEKDRERRYQSTIDLAQDLGRYLSHEPILASPPSALYRMKKFANRHRAGVSAAALVALSLMAGTAASTAGYMEARQERALAEDNAEEARTEAARANAVVDLMTQALSSADPHETRGPDYTVRELLEQFAADLTDQLQDQPDVEATLRSIIGKAFLHLGAPDEGAPHLERAIAIARDRHGEESEQSVDALYEWAWLLHDQGKLVEAEQTFRSTLQIQRRLFDEPSWREMVILQGLGDVLSEQGEFDEGLEVAREALEMSRALFGVQNLKTANLTLQVAKVLHDQTLFAEAEPVYRQALEIYRGLDLGDHPPLATCLNNLGYVIQAAWGDLDEAEALLREALDMRVRMYGNEHAATAISRSSLGQLLEKRGFLRDAVEVIGESGDSQALARVLKKKGEFDKAESLVNLEMENSISRLGPDHPKVIKLRYDLVTLRAAQRDHAEADRLLQDLLPMVRKRFGETHWIVGKMLLDRALAAYVRGDDAAGARLYDEGMHIYLSTYGPEHLETIGADFAFAANHLLPQGRYDVAAPILERVCSTRERLLGPDDMNTLASLSYLAEAKRRLGDCETAFELSTRLLDGFRRTTDAGSPEYMLGAVLNHAMSLLCIGDRSLAADLFHESLDSFLRQANKGTQMEAVVRWRLAYLANHLGEHAVARELAAEALDFMGDQLGALHLNTLGATRELGVAMVRAGSAEEAEPVLRDAMQRIRELDSARDVRVAEVEGALGVCLTALGRFGEAEPLLTACYDVLRADSGDTHPETQWARKGLVELYEAWGMPEKAAEWRAKLPEESKIDEETEDGG